MKIDENWKFLLQFLPQGWEQMAKELGAVPRQRKTMSAKILLRILLIHLADSCSMRETIVRAKESQLADISDITLFKCLKASAECLRWISVTLVKQVHGIDKKPDWLKKFNLLIVDASSIIETGSTGSDWRLQRIDNFPFFRKNKPNTQPSLKMYQNRHHFRSGLIQVFFASYR